MSVTYVGKVRMEMKNNNYVSFFKTKPKKVERYIRCKKNVVEIWNGVGTFHHKSNVRSVDILYIHNLMSQIVPHCQKHGKNILNYMRKRE